MMMNGTPILLTEEYNEIGKIIRYLGWIDFPKESRPKEGTYIGRTEKITRLLPQTDGTMIPRTYWTYGLPWDETLRDDRIFGTRYDSIRELLSTFQKERKDHEDETTETETTETTSL